MKVLISVLVALTVLACIGIGVFYALALGLTLAGALWVIAMILLGAARVMVPIILVLAALKFLLKR